MEFEILMFSRPQCGGCQLLKPKLVNVANNIGADMTYVDLSTEIGETIGANYPDSQGSLPIVLFIRKDNGEILDILTGANGAIWDWSESVLKEYIEYNVITLTGDTYGGGTLPTAVVTPEDDNNKTTVFKFVAFAIIGKLAYNKFS